MTTTQTDTANRFKALYRAAMSGLLDAAREVQERGTFGYLDRALTTPELNDFMQG
ncbi:MAG: hypothetical protein ACRDIB_04830 [Ardenticatenaceae bacterium]